METLQGLHFVANYLIAHDREMPLNRLVVLLLVSKAPKEGALVRDIVKQTGLNQSTIARTLALLGDKPIRGKASGLKWVKTSPDRDDPRRVRIFMTEQGKKVLTDCSAFLGS